MDADISGQDPVRVLVVSPVRIYRQGLARLLGAEASIQVAGTAPDVSSAKASPARLRADVVLFDLSGRTSGNNGLADLRRLVDSIAAPVVGLGIPDRPADVIACAEMGIAAYVSNEDNIPDLIGTLCSTARRQLGEADTVASGLVLRLGALARERQSSLVPQLTARELEIVWLLDSGLSNKEIARKLNIQLATVKNHVHNILGKLGVRRRTEAAAVVRRQFGRPSLQSSVWRTEWVS